MSIEGTVQMYPPLGTAFLVDDGSALLFSPQNSEPELDIAYRIAPIHRSNPDACDLLHIESRVTDAEGIEYRCEEYVSTYDLYRDAVIETLQLRRDVLNKINSAGFPLASVSENVLMEGLYFFTD